MFLCKWRARKQISLHRDNKVVLYLQSINKGTELIQPWNLQHLPTVHQQRHWTHSAMKPTAVISSPSTKPLNSFSQRGHLQSINTGTELIQPWSLQHLPTVNTDTELTQPWRLQQLPSVHQHRHWTQSAMKPTAVTYSQSTQALNSVSHEAYSSYLQTVNTGTELVSHESYSSYLQSINRHWTHPARAVTFSPSTQALNSVSPVPTESPGVLGW